MVLRLRLGRLLGLTCFVVALLTYRSYSHHPLLGRWSYAFAAVLLGAIGAWLAALIGSWRSAQAGADGAVPGPATALLDVGFLCWGGAYLLSSIDAPATAAKILDLNLFGSATPSAALLAWIALLATTLAAAIAAFRRLAPRYANPAVACGAVILFALVGEGAARVKAVAAPATEGFPTYSTELWYRRYVHLNGAGFRDGPHALNPEPGTRRLLLIGDSFAFGVGIKRREDRFGEQLGARVADLTGARWEVINASWGDLNTLDEIAVLQRVLPCQPDVVVLEYVFNDIDYLSPVTERPVVAEAPQTIFARLHPIRVLFKNSYLFQELYVRMRLLTRSRSAWAGLDAYADSSVLARHLGDVGRFVGLAGQTGAVVGIVPFDHTVTLGGAIRGRYDTFVRRARASGLPVWPVDAAFGGLQLSQLTVNRLDSHPNELADRLAAEAVAGQLVAALERSRPHTR